MEVDKSIVRLGEQLDTWWTGLSAVLETKDPIAQGKVLLRGLEIAKQVDHLKADGLAAITALLNRHDPVADDERAASLIRGFEFAAKLKHTLHDELSDADGANKTVGLMNEIANALDTIGSGRAVLGALLDHPDAGVRASAGAFLLNLTPDRVVPILREIAQEEHGNDAHFTAYWAVRRWELERKARSAALAHDTTYDELLVHYRSAVVDRLERIYDPENPADEQDRFLIIEFSDRPQDYVQCVFDTPTKMLCEASSGFFYSAPSEPRRYRLPAPSIAALGRLGFSTDNSAGNFRISIDVTNPPDFKAIADFMLKALYDGYGARAELTLRFNAPLAIPNRRMTLR